MSSQHDRDPYMPIIQQVREYICSNLHEPLSVDALAGSVYYSSRHLNRYFELSTLFGWSSGGVYGAGVVLPANVCIFNGADFSAEYEQNAEATQMAADELLAKLNNLN